ncbi:MAG: hypothetical protein AAF518_12535 [Spirochaetota bacterium]
MILIPIISLLCIPYLVKFFVRYTTHGQNPKIQRKFTSWIAVQYATFLVLTFFCLFLSMLTSWLMELHPFERDVLGYLAFLGMLNGGLAWLGLRIASKQKAKLSFIVSSVAGTLPALLHLSFWYGSCLLYRNYKIGYYSCSSSTRGLYIIKNIWLTPLFILSWFLAVGLALRWSFSTASESQKNL